MLANDTDVDGGPKTIASASDPANGTVVLTGGGGPGYLPARPQLLQHAAGDTPDTFTYTLNGGATATVSVTVTCVDDDPVRSTTPPGHTRYTENAAATAIDAVRRRSPTADGL